MNTMSTRILLIAITSLLSGCALLETPVAPRAPDVTVVSFKEDFLPYSPREAPADVSAELSAQR